MNSFIERVEEDTRPLSSRMSIIWRVINRGDQRGKEEARESKRKQGMHGKAGEGKRKQGRTRQSRAKQGKAG